MKNLYVINLVLLLVAAIWGAGFVPQKLGMDYVGPYSFNAMRFLLGALTLLPIVFVQKRARQSILDFKTIAIGLLLGTVLTIAAALQQISIQFTSLANVAFITGLYVIIIPLVGFWLGTRYSKIVWFGGIIAIIGLYLLTNPTGSGFAKGELLAVLSSIFWAVQILMLARFVKNYSWFTLAFYQFLFCALLSAGMSMVYEDKLLPTEQMGYVWAAANGIFVVGIAYTLQLILLEYAEPFMASVIFSLEAVFGALAGYLVFNETLGAISIIGASMMLLGGIIVQLPSATKPSPRPLQ